MLEFEGKIINGKLVSQRIRGEIKAKTENFVEKFGRKPTLAVILVGDNPASQVYVRNKKNACAEVGFESREYVLPGETTQDELNRLVERLNSDGTVDGILVQLPLPKHLSEKEIIEKISPDKDVDCFHPYNVGRLVAGTPDFLPCTPAGIIELIKAAGVEISGKTCVVCGRSNIVGKPVAHLLMAENGTVTITHRKTADLKSVTRGADILVGAIGEPKYFDASFVKPGAIIIDVGMNRDENGKLCGDFDFDSVFPVCGGITPVPGGVGPMTVTMLMKNTLKAAERHEER